MSFAAVVAAPRKLVDRVVELQAALELLKAENEALKTRVHSLKTRIDSLIQLVDVKAKEVETHIKEETRKEVHSTTTSMGDKMKKLMDIGLHKRRMQEKNASSLQLGGLPPRWFQHLDSLDKKASFLEGLFSPIKIKFDSVELLQYGDPIPCEQVALRFSTPEVVFGFFNKHTS